MMRNSVKKLFLAACAVMVLGSCTVEECTRGLTLCALPGPRRPSSATASGTGMWPLKTPPSTCTASAWLWQTVLRARGQTPSAVRSSLATGDLSTPPCLSMTTDRPGSSGGNGFRRTTTFREFQRQKDGRIPKIDISAPAEKK